MFWASSRSGCLRHLLGDRTETLPEWAGDVRGDSGGMGHQSTIETMQVFLPTRDSDMTDVITNTIGTCIGAGLFRLHAARYAIDRLLDGSELGCKQFVGDAQT